ncbi:MAG: hypothetical protein OSA51_09925 [Octadecabacter sp.]|nr:hypothetical protein [Octadecabacter sp.]
MVGASHALFGIGNVIVQGVLIRPALPDLANMAHSYIPLLSIFWPLLL